MSWVKCPRDHHVWKTQSNLVMVTCPSCYRKINLQENLVDPSELMEHFNLGEDGVKILDRTLSTEHSPNGMVIDVFFKRQHAWCEYDQTENCKHVEFALSLPIVREILKKKGWKL